MTNKRLYNTLSIGYLTLACSAIASLVGQMFFGLHHLSLLVYPAAAVGIVGGYDLIHRPAFTAVKSFEGIPFAYLRQRITVKVMIYLLFTGVSALMFGFAGKILLGTLGQSIAGILGTIAGLFISSQVKPIKSIRDLFNI